MNKRAVQKRVTRERDYLSKKKGLTHYKSDYRVSSQSTDKQFIKLSGKGYQEQTKLQKLQFKSGKLTKAGKQYLESLQKDTSAEGRWKLREFETYRTSKINKGQFLTLERFTSHLQNSKLLRMIYNFGTTPDEIAEQLNETVNNLNVSGNDVLSMNWDFDNDIITYKNYVWQIAYDYQSYNGFKISLIQGQEQ